MENSKINKKVIIIIMLIILICIIGILAWLLSMNGDTEQESANIVENTITQNTREETVSQPTFEEVDDYDTYYTVRGILNNYITTIQSANGDEYIDFGRLEESREEAIESLVEEATTTLYNIFDSEYRDENNITEESIQNLIQQYTQQGDYSQNITYFLNISEMYVADMTTDIQCILVTFSINDIEETMIIKLDLENNTYSMFGQEYVEEHGYNSDTKIADIDIDTNSIEDNNYNYFNSVSTNDQYLINQYFSEYQSAVLNNVDNAYLMLDEEYSETKYENAEEFYTYIEENYEELQNAYLTKYQVNQFEDFKEYVGIDNNNHYYIFIEKSLTDYEVILDTYTIDLKDFTDQYETADISTKVGLNVEKVIDAINDGDYRYVYNKLDETFKNNNYASLDEFTAYMSENFYENNEIEYLEFSEEGTTYIYTANIINADDENSEEKSFTIIMQLLEGTNFVMSFSIE